MGEREKSTREKDGDPTRFKPKRRNGNDENALDEAIEESFPASDPPAVTRDREPPVDPPDGDREP